jgi:hypothetical protein
MVGRGVWYLLAGCFLTSGLVTGQERISDPPVMLARPMVPLGISSRPIPPIPLPILRVPISASPAGFGFAQLERAAGRIFAGTVTRIQREAAIPGQTIETVCVSFYVENAIRGAVPGGEVTIREWSGLWSLGQRYHVGERLLLFLYPNSKIGLTSWVAGPMGHLAVDSSGEVLLTAQQVAAFRTDPVLGGKSRLPFSDFALAVRRASEEE